MDAVRLRVRVNVIRSSALTLVSHLVFGPEPTGSGPPEPTGSGPSQLDRA